MRKRVRKVKAVALLGCLLLFPNCPNAQERGPEHTETQPRSPQTSVPEIVFRETQRLSTAQPSSRRKGGSIARQELAASAESLRNALQAGSEFRLSILGQQLRLRPVAMTDGNLTAHVLDMAGEEIGTAFITYGADIFRRRSPQPAKVIELIRRGSDFCGNGNGHPGSA